jgi:glycerol uptake facilitator-like aquaporin
MEVIGGSDNKIAVCIYECLAVSALTYAAMASAGNSEAVAFTLFILILMIGPVSGGHVNPAVTCGVFVNGGNYGRDIVFFLMILLAQFAGALLGVFWSWLVLMPADI